MEFILVTLLLLLIVIPAFFYNRNILLERKNGVLEAEKKSLENTLLRLQKECDSLHLSLKEASQQAASLEKMVAIQEGDKKHLLDKLKQHEIDLEKMEAKFKIEFENISNRIFSYQSEHFKNTSKESIQLLMNPLLNDLKNINQALLNESKSKDSLQGAINQIVSSHKMISEQSENLTNALKGNSQMQGHWGEVMLKKILEEAGLREGHDYISQGKSLGLKNPEDEKKTAKPDIIVNLPENKHIIIDSKISLTDYERYFSENNELAKQESLKKFIKSIQRHIDDLASKRYHDITDLQSPEFVILFFGIESAYALAAQHYSELHSYAWDRKIVIVNPATLFATLKTIASVWRLERQNQNALVIAQQGGRLYDKLVGFVEDMKTMEKQLRSLTDCHTSAMKKLSEGKGNALQKAEELRLLGIKSSKNLPVDMVILDQSEHP